MTKKINPDIRPPQQTRSKKTYESIICSTLSLLEHQTFEQLTISEIAAKAGTAVGNFYRRFENKEALLPHLYEEYDRRFAELARSMMQSSAKTFGWAQVVSSTVAFFVENRGLIRALHLHSRLKPTLTPDDGRTDRRGLYERLAHLITSPNDESQIKKNKARAAALVLVSTITEAIIYPEQPPASVSGLDTKEFEKELIIMLEAYSSA